MKDNGYLRELRNKAGLTQQNVADLLGVTKSFISKIESGKSGFGNISIEKLAQIYNTTPAFIITGKTEEEWQHRLNEEVRHAQEEEEAYWTDVLIDETTQRIMQIISKLNETGIEKAIERLNELSEIPRYQRTESSDMGG